jgi:hypothetical protein
MKSALPKALCHVCNDVSTLSSACCLCGTHHGCCGCRCCLHHAGRSCCPLVLVTKFVLLSMCSFESWSAPQPSPLNHYQGVEVQGGSGLSALFS